MTTWRTVHSKGASARLEDFGEFSDELATVLLQIASGHPGARNSPTVNQGITLLNELSVQLLEPFFARPELSLLDAIHLAEYVKDAGSDETIRQLQSQREYASEYFGALRDQLLEVSDGSASADVAAALAHQFDLLGAGTLVSRSSLSSQRRPGAWATA